MNYLLFDIEYEGVNSPKAFVDGLNMFRFRYYYLTEHYIILERGCLEFPDLSKAPNNQQKIVLYAQYEDSRTKLIKLFESSQVLVTQNGAVNYQYLEYCYRGLMTKFNNSSRICVNNNKHSTTTLSIQEIWQELRELKPLKSEKTTKKSTTFSNFPDRNVNERDILSRLDFKSFNRALRNFFSEPPRRVIDHDGLKDGIDFRIMLNCFFLSPDEETITQTIKTSFKDLFAGRESAPRKGEYLNHLNFYIKDLSALSIYELKFADHSAHLLVLKEENIKKFVDQIDKETVDKNNRLFKMTIELFHYKYNTPTDIYNYNLTKKLRKEVFTGSQINRKTDFKNRDYNKSLYTLNWIDI